MTSSSHRSTSAAEGALPVVQENTRPPSSLSLKRSRSSCSSASCLCICCEMDTASIALQVLHL